MYAKFQKAGCLECGSKSTTVRTEAGSQEVRVLYRAGKYGLAEPHNGSKTQEMKGSPRVKSTEKM